MSKNWTFFSILFLALFGIAQAKEPSTAKKIYCEVSQIELTNAMILVHLNDQTIEVDGLNVDQGGIYFVEEMMRCVHCRRPFNPRNICESPRCLAKK